VGETKRISKSKKSTLDRQIMETCTRIHTFPNKPCLWDNVGQDVPVPRDSVGQEIYTIVVVNPLFCGVWAFCWAKARANTIPLLPFSSPLQPQLS